MICPFLIRSLIADYCLTGVITGFVGAVGNLGGIIMAIIFRFTGNYPKSIWIIGIFYVAINVSLCWIKPLPKGQIGGR